MKAYKGFNKHEDGTLWCRGFQYEVGKSYTFDGEPKLCKQGFHACHEPYQCWCFYPNNGENVYYEVECGGKVIESDYDDGKFACTEIALIQEISAPEMKHDWCSSFNDGFARVELNRKHNFINTNGELLLRQWFDECGSFHEGFAAVKLNNRWNFINRNRQYLSKQWFDWCGDFKDGFARVGLNGKYNFINKDGKLLSEQWFDRCVDFYEGFARVELKGKWYKIDKNGKIIEQ